MKRSLLIFFILIGSVPSYSFDEAEYQVLLRENSSLKTLEEYKDDSLMIRAKMLQADKINSYRVKRSLQPVKLDILASRVANMQAADSARNGYHGHWNMRGEKPYHRYGLAGGRDHVLENGFTTGSTGGSVIEDLKSYDDADLSSRYLAQASDTMIRGVEGFIMEGPGGGHYRNVMNPYHNYVGLGYSAHNVPTGGYQESYYEEFVDRYIEFDVSPLKAKVNEEITISGRVIPEDTGVYAFVAYYEPLPTPMTAAQINARGSYPDYTNEKAVMLWPWQIPFDQAKRAFKFRFKGSKKGYYYIQIYLKKGIKSIPYDARSGASTEGLAVGSGMVIVVE